MKSMRFFVALWAALLFSFGSMGCNNQTPTEASKPSESSDDHGHDHGDEGHDHGDEGHAHAHPTEGPHGGDLIELGEEEYHAELVHDHKSGAVTIYILDGSVKEAVAIGGEKITINLKHDGKPEQFSLTAAPQKSDPEGKSSVFESKDKHLAEALDEEGAEARLQLTINGTPYSGRIEHDHHDHDHGDHDHGDHDHGKKGHDKDHDHDHDDKKSDK